MNWIYEQTEFEPEETFLQDYVGFVYEITEKSTGKKYIGKKFFWKNVIRSVNKKRKKVKVQSDWRNYYGSNKSLLEQISGSSEDDYVRVIIRLCKSKGECSYYEAKEQFDRSVLFDDKYYNEFIGCKIHSKHVRTK